MKQAITIAAALAAVAVATPAHAGAAGVCIQRDTNKAGNEYDSEYFLRNGASPNVNGFDALDAAKEDHRNSYPNSKPYCRHNGNDFAKGGGYFVLIQTGRKKDVQGAHMNRWALGFGINREMAIVDAKKELARRDPLWRDDTHGFTITEEDKI